MKIFFKLLAVSVLVLATFVLYQSGLTLQHDAIVSQLPATEAVVVSVLDGDTIRIASGEKVRLIGIDAPERPDDCYSQEATDALTDLVLHKTVTLRKDKSETDRYGRLLRYVYVGDVFVNKALVEAGAARAKSYPPDTTFAALLKEAERVAKTQRAGLWAACNVAP